MLETVYMVMLVRRVLDSYVCQDLVV
jgi:hypothetical protein